MAVPVCFVQEGSTERAATPEARVLSLGMYIVAILGMRSRELRQMPSRAEANELFAQKVQRAALDLWPGGGDKALDEILALALKFGLTLPPEAGVNAEEVLN